MDSRLAWAVSGAAAAAVAIGVGEITAALLGGGSIIVAIGALVISLQPPGGKDLMVELFGTNDKLALEVGTAVGGILIGAALGLLARYNLRFALAGFGVFGLVAFVLLLRDPLIGMLSSAASAAAAIAAGSLMLVWLTAWQRPIRAVEPDQTGDVRVDTRARTVDRRSVLALTATFVAVGGVLALIGRYLGSQISVAGPGEPVADLPSPGRTLSPPAAGTDFAISGLTPAVVSNADFYRIDTRLDVPRVSVDTWSLRIWGRVDREVTLNYAQLLAMPLVEQYVTIACVSNDVGGHLVGNAKWTGVRLVPLLESAGVHAGASQLVGRSFDGWTAGFPTAHLAGAGSEAMLAVGMNGVPLPAAHGFPARLIVPGLYGYVSATKWITEIELTTLEAFDAYWVPLGWAKEAPILTQSRIDVPRFGAGVRAGAAEIAGVAWAPTRGISRVEVDLDESEQWQPAELSVPLSTAAWVQWRVMVDVPAGNHTLRVRATDGTGETQSAERTRPAPDGARGYHTIRFTAS